MKIAFDENVPMAMVRVFKTLTTEGDLPDAEILSAKEYTQQPADDDVPWIRRFAADGGRVIISGDVRMRANLHEQAALFQEGMIVIFFDGQWSTWAFYDKSAFLLKWWPRIMALIRDSKPGDFWHIPCSWSDDAEARHVRPNPDAISKHPPKKSGR